VSRVSGKTPLMAAVEYGSLDMVAIFLKAGSNVNLRNKSGETAFDIAGKHGRTEIAGLLRAFGAVFSDYADQDRAHQGTDGIDQYYAILGCKKTDSIDHIKAQYRQLIKQYHPDVIQGKGLSEEFLELANKKFGLILEAYRHIMNKNGPSHPY
jgi:DnaJ-domain-containing protein 1